MPKYKVTTDQGTFQVELDREPDSQDQLQSMVSNFMSGKQGQAPDMPSLAPRVAAPTQGQPLPPETTFQQGPELPKEESTFTKLARQPAELLGKAVGGAVNQASFGTVPGETAGEVVKNLVPSTPAGWGGLAGSTAVGMIPGVGQAATGARLLAPLLRAGGAALGAAGGAVAGGETAPLEIGKEAAISGGGQLAGEAVGKGLTTGGAAVMRQLKGGTTALLKDYGQKLSALIPDIDPATFTPSKFFETVLGGKGHKSLDKMYGEGVDEIMSAVGPNAFIQDPTVSRIIQEYLPKSKMATNLSTITQPLRAQGGLIPPGQAPSAAPAAAVAQSAPRPRPNFEVLEPLPPQATGSAAQPSVEKIVMGKSGVRGMNVTPSAERPPISETAFPEGLSSTPSPLEQARTSSYLAPPYNSQIRPMPTQQGGTPAHLVLGDAERGQPVSIANAMKAAQEIGAASREMSKAKLRTPTDVARMRDMRQANEELRQAIADNLDNIAPDMGARYKEINDAFRKGTKVLEILKDNAEAIFPQGITQPRIDAAALARVHNLALEELNRLGPAGEALASASRRGAVPGAGDISLKIPGAGLFFGTGSGLRGSVPSSTLPRIPIAAGSTGGAQVSPLLSGAAGQRVLDLLRSNQQPNTEEKRKLLEQLGLTR